MECKNCESLATGDSQYCSFHEEMLGIKTTDTNQASEVREGDASISDKEAWLRIFETIRPTVHTTGTAIYDTNEAFDAMKTKLEAEL